MLDKLTGKLPAELKGGKAKILAPIESVSHAQPSQASLKKIEKDEERPDWAVTYSSNTNVKKAKKE